MSLTVARRRIPALLALLLLLLPTLLHAQALPAITSPVTELAGVLSQEQQAAIASALVTHRAALNVQLAVLLVQSTEGRPIEDFSHAVAEQWGGGTAGTDRGVLLTFALRDHHSRIEVGRGLEAQLTDVAARRLLDAARPQLRAGDYFGAVSSVVNGIISATGGNATVGTPLVAQPAPSLEAPPLAPTFAVPTYSPPPVYLPPPYLPPTHQGTDGVVCFLMLVVGMVVLFGLFAMVRALQGGQGSYSSTGGGWVSGGYYGSSSGYSSSSWSSDSSSSDYSSGSSTSDWSSGSSSSDYSSGSSGSDYSGGGGGFDGGGASSDW